MPRLSFQPMAVVSVSIALALLLLRFDCRDARGNVRAQGANSGHDEIGGSLRTISLVLYHASCRAQVTAQCGRGHYPTNATCKGRNRRPGHARNLEEVSFTRALRRKSREQRFLTAFLPMSWTWKWTFVRRANRTLARTAHYVERRQWVLPSRHVKRAFRKRISACA